jgi:hypothetical protein
MKIPTEQKQWWAPVWKGLVMDADAKHYRKMKNAVWLYLYLLLNANRWTGLLKRKIETISQDMGISRVTVIRWLNVLRSNGYIATSNTGRALTIQVERWKPIVGKEKTPPQQYQDHDFRSIRNATSRIPGDRTNPEQNDRTSIGGAMPKETMININIKNEMQNTCHNESVGRELSPIGGWVQRERLARELASALDDPVRINLYRAYCWRYPEWHLRTVLSRVQSTPEASITKGRAALLFTELVQRYVQGDTENPGD